MIAALESDDGVVIKDFLAAETREGLRRDLLPLLARQSAGRDGFSGYRTRRLSVLFAHTSHSAEIASHPLYLPAAEHFLCRPRELWVGDSRFKIAADVRIGVTQAIQIGPGQPAQPPR